MKFCWLVLALLTVTLECSAGRIMMSSPKQSSTENGKTLCFYSNSIYTFTFVTKSKRCPYSKTFDTDDSE
ncbi:hypothetical protein ACX8ZY_02855 [Pantoea sp. XAF26B01_ASV70]|uniref:hypothetical protein n=1 Tax=Enterobacter agglomerans TaxID=549 RepID=UPI001E59D470|nr:hypothetical protein [Pantoea agglomerans]